MELKWSKRADLAGYCYRAAHCLAQHDLRGLRPLMDHLAPHVDSLSREIRPLFEQDYSNLSTDRARYWAEHMLDNYTRIMNSLQKDNVNIK